MSDQAELPPCVARYLEAENGDAVGAVEECFSADAQVRDEGRTLRGREQIREWKRAAKARYRYTIEFLSARREGENIIVRVLTSGDFPGSPLAMEHVMRVAGDRIVSMGIH